MRQIPTFSSGRISCLSCKIYDLAKVASLGKSLFRWEFDYVVNYEQKSVTHSGFYYQTSSLQQYTRYRPADLKECALIIHDWYLSRRGASLQAVRDKYKQHKVYQILLIILKSKIVGIFFLLRLFFTFYTVVRIN